MAASIHPLFPGAASDPPRPAANAPAVHPLVVALRQATLSVLQDSLRRLFERADDLLFDMGEKAAGDLERRRYFDTMRVLRLENARVVQVFGADFERGFVPSLAGAPGNTDFDLDRLAIQPTEELEERIAVSNLANKAEGLFKNAVWEVECRLALASREFNVPVAPQALSPTRICEAFGAAIGGLDTEFQVKLVIYKLLDRSVLRDFERVYAAALDVFDRQGIKPGRKSAGDPPSGGTSEAAVAPVSAGELLRRHGLDPEHLQNTASPAAADLGRLLQALLAPDADSIVQASGQRLAVAARLLEEILSEPLLPAALRPAIENLRYPVYRSALTDAQFLADTGHPLRKLLAELVESAIDAQSGSDPGRDSGSNAVSDISGNGLGARVNDLLRRAAAFNAAARPGTESLLNGGGADLNFSEHLIQQLREQTRARREALLMRVRRQIAQELETQTLGRDVPAPVMKLLRAGVGPLMALRLLRHGRGSATFQDARDLVERVLHSLEFIPPPTPFELQAREELLGAVQAALAAVNMEPAKLATLLAGLREVYTLLDGQSEGRLGTLTPREEQLAKAEVEPALSAEPQMPAALPSITVMELLGRVLAPESWYRVFDADQNQTRWLKLTAFYPQQDNVMFSGFDESNRLRLRALRFASDLAQGFSEPINPAASARAALEALRSAKARGVF